MSLLMDDPGQFSKRLREEDLLQTGDDWERKTCPKSEKCVTIAELIEQNDLKALAERFAVHPALKYKRVNDRDFPITYAIRLGRFCVVKWLYFKDITYADQPLIVTAAIASQLEILKWLLKIDDKSDAARRVRRLHLLGICAEANNLETIKWFIHEGYFKVTDKPHGTDALLIACRSGRFEVVQWLIERGAFLNRVGKGCTLLLTLKYMGADVMKWLITQKHAGVEEVGKKGHTTLMRSAMRGDLSTVKWLVEEAKANIEHACYSEGGLTATAFACKQGHLAIAQYLICERGAVYESCAFSCVGLAIENGHFELVQWFVNGLGVSVSYKSLQHLSLLIVAVRANKLEIVKWLVGEGADKEDTTPNKRTALMFSSSLGYFDIVKFLVSSGANLCSRSRSAKFPLWFALSQGHYEIAKFLVLAGACVNETSVFMSQLLCLAISSQRHNVVKCLVTVGKVSLRPFDNDSVHPIKIAIQMGDFELVQWLVKEYPDPYQLQPELLESAVIHRRVEIVRWLLAEARSLVDMNAALTMALKTGSVKMVRMLVLAGAKTRHLPRRDCEIQGMICDAVDKACKKKTREVLSALGLNRNVLSLVGVYSMPNAAEANAQVVASNLNRPLWS